MLTKTTSVHDRLLKIKPMSINRFIIWIFVLGYLWVNVRMQFERLLSIASVGNDRLGSTPVQFLMQLGAVVSLVAEHAYR